MPGFKDGHALIVGIANYPKARKLPPTVLKDARDVYHLLCSPDHCCYLAPNIRLLLDSQATASAIRSGLRWLSSTTGPGDTALIFFSGHGGRVVGGSHAGNYLLSYDFDPADLTETAISGDELTGLLRHIRAQRLLVFFDSCYSGGAGEAKCLDLEQVDFKAGLEESYYERLAQGAGRVIMASSRSDEVSLVLPAMANSLFTHYLLEALRGNARTRGDGLIRVFDVFDYVSEKVPARGPQHPIFKATDLENNFAIALHRGSQQEAESEVRKKLLLEPVPAVLEFIGREAALAAYGKELQRERLTIIRGLAGVGKTTLGARLARQEAAREEQIFWCTFDSLERNTADALLWSLAAFLDIQGYPNLWRYMQGELDTQKPLETTVKLNLLFAGLASGDYLLCLDDVQEVKDAPDILHFFRLLHQRFIGRRQPLPARFILMGRQVALEMEYLVSKSLGGFTYEETGAFVGARNLSLPPPLLHQLWTHTEGNPMLLELSASALAGMDGDQAAMERFLRAMARRGDVCDYLMTEVYAALQPDERQIAGFLSIFPVPVEQEAAEEILAAEGVTGAAPLITALGNKSVISETEDGRIQCHNLVRAYCHRLLDRKDKERFHQRAAQYYEQSRNYLAAAYHHFQRGAQEQALDLLTSHTRAIINAGGAGSLLEQLAGFERQRLSSRGWEALCRAQGDAHRIRGEYEKAVTAYEAALQEATDDEIRTELLHRIGLTYSQGGEYLRAIQYSMDSLAISQALGNQAGMAHAYHTWGWACYRLGRLRKARELFTVVREMAQEMEDRLLLARAGLGLGLIAWRKKQPQEARAYFEASRRIFHDLGDRVRQAEAVVNLGLIYGEMGDVDQELSCYHEALEIHGELGYVGSLHIIYNNLGNLYHLLGNHPQAAFYYERLAQLAQDTGHRPMLSTAYAGLADAHLALGNSSQALEYARQAQETAQDIGLSAELGVSARVLGDVWMVLGDPVQARTWFEQSIPLLKEAQEDEELAKARRGLARIPTKSLIGN